MVRIEPQEEVTYACTSCGMSVVRENLKVKRVAFYDFGERGKLRRTRTLAWLCPDCIKRDDDWNRPSGRGGTPQPPKATVDG